MDRVNFSRLLEGWIGKIQGQLAEAAPHSSNLLHQIYELLSQVRRSGLPGLEKFTALEQIIPLYLSLTSSINGIKAPDYAKSLDAPVDLLNKYLDLLETKVGSPFVSQSDFKTSVVPEFFLRLFAKLIAWRKCPLKVVGQQDIPIEIAFDLGRKQLFLPHTQRVDVGIVFPAALMVNKFTLNNFCIPVFAAESKTYFDKNMISGVDFSVRALKNTFPQCLYYAIGERTDFSVDTINYANSSIDEIIVLRRQKRGDFRRTGKAEPIAADLVLHVVQEVDGILLDFGGSRPSLDERLKTGRLIWAKVGETRERVRPRTPKPSEVSARRSVEKEAKRESST